MAKRGGRPDRPLTRRQTTPASIMTSTLEDVEVIFNETFFDPQGRPKVTAIDLLGRSTVVIIIFAHVRLSPLFEISQNETNF